MKTINCGDWHLGWGFGGNDKIGKLSTDDDKVFIWRGRSQGRHGQKWNRNASCSFNLKDGKVNIIESKGSLPRNTELVKSALALIAMIPKKKRVKKTQVRSINNQLNLDL